MRNNLYTTSMSFREKRHKAELDKWKQTDRFIRQRLPDQPYSAAALQKELSSLKAKIDELNEKLAPYQEETKMLKDIRYLVKDLIPELTPEGEKMTAESKEWRQMSVRERLAAAQKVVDEREAAKPQRHRKERDIEL